MSPTSHTRQRGGRAGMTLIELLVSLVLFAIFGAVVMRTMTVQGNGIGRARLLFDAQRNAEYGVAQVERELRVAGIGLVTKQPLLIQADPFAIAFNADLITITNGDLTAVYYNNDADAGSASVWAPSAKATLPLSTFTYPDSAMTQNGVSSNAETIQFYLDTDPTDGVTGTKALFRRVNNLTPQIVARNIKYSTTQPVFQYYVKSPTGLVEYVKDSLPIYHRAGTHGAANDTGPNARIDSIRVVTINMTGLMQDRKTKTISERPISLTVRIVNQGLLLRSTCGNSPNLGQTPSAQYDALTSQVTVRWNAAADETSGERDVERYRIYRRLSTETRFAEPVASITAGNASYRWTDNAVTSGLTYVYGVAAVDCSPLSSPISLASRITIP